jgi:phosphate starvation-inducible protein PhoH and related proteins|tara:strand:+ start:218 stop:892 length:675 start_codon:yes stop_codon:yes gene_type:complete
MEVIMAKQNIEKTPPKGNVKFSISLSEEQKSAKQAMLHHPYNFIVGKAGSGKTLLACQVALDMFFKRMINKIIITRPTVSTEDNGFLPGSEKEKMEPWLVPIRSNMRKVYNKPLILDKMEKEESIELVSLAHFRGRTFENSVVIVDEFQNLTRSQLRMALGRLGKGSTMIFCGDNQQIDLKDKNYSAIVDVSKISDSEYVYKRILLDNHRHPAIDNVFEMLMSM